MKIEDLIRKYEKATNKETFLRNRITTNYLPFEQKLTMCERIVKATCYKEVSDKSIFWMNTPAQFMLFSISIIQNYTDIELSNNVIDDFNVLDQNGLIDALVSCVSEREYDMCLRTLNMMIDDIRENERNITSWLESKKDTLEQVAVSFMESLAELDITE